MGSAFDISQAVAMAAGLGSRDRRSLYACAVARGVANTRCSVEQERRYGVLRLLTLATLRLPDLAVYGELLHSQDGAGCAACLVAQALIGASSGAMRLAHRALEMHSRDVGYRVDAWRERALDGARDELRQSEAAEGSPATLDPARLATLALTGATRLDGERADAGAGPDRRRARPPSRDLHDRRRGRLGDMTEWLLSALERVPPRARRVGVGVAALLLLGAAITALTLGPPPGGGARSGRPTSRGPSQQTSTHSPPRDLPPMSALELLQARDAAKRFLVTYLRFAYGRASAMVVKAVTPELHTQLVRERAQVTPAEGQRHPHVVSLRVVGIMPGFVAATAAVADGGIAMYPLRFTLQRSAGRWSVSGVQAG